MRGGLGLDLKKWGKLIETQKTTGSGELEEKKVVETFEQVLCKFVKKEAYGLVLGATEKELESYKELGYLNFVGINLEGSAKIQKMDMHDLRFSDKQFDVVIARTTMEHAFAPFLVFLEVRRVLKNKGYFVFTLQKFTRANWYFEHCFLVTSEYAKEVLPKLFAFKVLYFQEGRDEIIQVWKKDDSSNFMFCWPKKNSEDYNWIKNWSWKNESEEEIK